MAVEGKYLDHSRRSIQDTPPITPLSEPNDSKLEKPSLVVLDGGKGKEEKKVERHLITGKERPGLLYNLYRRIDELEELKAKAEQFITEVLEPGLESAKKEDDAITDWTKKIALKRNQILRYSKRILETQQILMNEEDVKGGKTYGENLKKYKEEKKKRDEEIKNRIKTTEAQINIKKINNQQSQQAIFDEAREEELEATIIPNTPPPSKNKFHAETPKLTGVKKLELMTEYLQAQKEYREAREAIEEKARQEGVVVFEEEYKKSQQILNKKMHDIEIQSLIYGVDIKQLAEEALNQSVKKAIHKEETDTKINELLETIRGPKKIFLSNEADDKLQQQSKAKNKLGPIDYTRDPDWEENLTVEESKKSIRDKFNEKISGTRSFLKERSVDRLERSIPEDGMTDKKIENIQKQIQDLLPIVTSIKIGWFGHLKEDLRNIPGNDPDILIKQLFDEAKKLEKKGKTSQAIQLEEQADALGKLVNLRVEEEKIKAKQMIKPPQPAMVVGGRKL